MARTFAVLPAGGGDGVGWLEASGARREELEIVIIDGTIDDADADDLAASNWARGPGRMDREPRTEVTVRVTIESESNFYAGFTESASDGGVFVATHVPKDIGCSIDLIIALPEQMPIRAKGTVRWLREYSEANDTVPGMGIRFDRLSRADALRIHEFAKSRHPMFFDGDAECSETVPSPWPCVG